MNAPNTLDRVSEYIEQKESKTSLWVISESIKGFDDLRQEIWMDKFSIWDKITNWLWKNNESLLEYAKNYLDIEKTKSDFWMQILELKLSITCSFFLDFKNFLDELKLGEYDTSENADRHREQQNAFVWLFNGINISDIKSLWFERNSETWVTWCSKTARENAETFGLNLPNWNAYDAGKEPWENCLHTIPEDRVNIKPNKNRSEISLDDFKNISNDNVNFADIFTKSSSNYWHRAMAFKDDWWQWYVLDPYIRVNWVMNNDPKKLEDYIAVRWIVKTHFYSSNGYHSTTETYV